MGRRVNRQGAKDAKEEVIERKAGQPQMNRMDADECQMRKARNFPKRAALVLLLGSMPQISSICVNPVYLRLIAFKI
jgi:hypothetical protein